ncbi:MAG: replication protein [Pyrinomonadaceae bacterium]
MTSKKRKYGDLSARALPSEDPSLIDDVFAAFTGTRPSNLPAAEPNATVVEAASQKASATPARRATPALHAAPAQQTSPAPRASAAQVEPEPLHRAAAAQYAAPAQQTTVAGYTRVSNDLLDRILSTLDTYDQVVLIRLYRLSRGFSSDTCRVSVPTLAKACNVSERQVRKSVGKLEACELVERIEQDFGNKDKSLRGTIFRILIADPTPARGATPVQGATHARSAAAAQGAANKDKDLKRNNKKGINRLTPEEIQSFTATVADLLGEGQSIEEVEPRFAPTMHPVDWATIRSTALAQVGPKKGK